MQITYKVRFFSDWHCGSGLAAGADVDALVVKDRDGLPFIPGKTVKGLLREAVEDIEKFRNSGNEGNHSKELSRIRKFFGYFDGKSSSDETRAEMMMGSAFFSNAEFPGIDRNTIVSKSLQAYLYRTLASTAIDEYGIAKDHSLRRIEVTVPCTLEGFILFDPEDKDMEPLVRDGLQYVKRLGQNRNRGLGRCSFYDIKVVTDNKPDVNKTNQNA